MPKAKGSIEIKAPAERVFETIVDFKGYPEFLSEIEMVEVESRSAKSARVLFAAQMMMKRVEYLLSFSFKHPSQISWKLASGDGTFSKNSGAWHLKRGKGASTVVEFEVDVEFGIWIPSFVANGLIKNHLPKMLESFKKRAEMKQSRKKGQQK